MDGWIGVELRVFGGMPHACMPGYTHARIHAHTNDDVIRDSPGFPYGSSYLHEIIMFIQVCTCMRACACACAYMHREPPQNS